MFFEIDPTLIKASAQPGKKRWFRDGLGDYDLFVWENEKGVVEKFQFWYHEALLEWSHENGYRTGTMDPKSGAFVNYQSELYKFHSDLDDDIISLVKNVLEKTVSDDSNTFNYIREILSEMAEHK
jgi:hypothetical protein